MFIDRCRTSHQARSANLSRCWKSCAHRGAAVAPALHFTFRPVRRAAPVRELSGPEGVWNARVFERLICPSNSATRLRSSPHGSGIPAMGCWWARRRRTPHPILGQRRAESSRRRGSRLIPRSRLRGLSRSAQTWAGLRTPVGFLFSGTHLKGRRAVGRVTHASALSRMLLRPSTRAARRAHQPAALTRSRRCWRRSSYGGTLISCRTTATS